jgi:uncharacterized coiled-coil protein SlyX
MSKSRAQREAIAAEAELEKIGNNFIAEQQKQRDAAQAEVNRLNAEGQQAPEPTPPAPPPVNEPAPINNGQSDWEQRYKSLQGMFAKSNETISVLTQRIDELTRTTVAAAQQPQQQVQQVPATSRLLTEAEIKDYGDEFIDVTKRAARELYDSKMETLEARIAELQKHVKQQEQTVTTVTAKAAEREEEAFYDALDRLAPTWETLNSDNNFLTWLNVTDTFTGASRRALLNQAFNAKDVNRVAAFFKAFAETAPGAPSKPTAPPVDAASLVSPASVSNGPAPTQPRRGKYWTQAEIEQIYDDKLRGKITLEQFTALEREALEALAEGRVR